MTSMMKTLLSPIISLSPALVPAYPQAPEGSEELTAADSVAFRAFETQAGFSAAEGREDGTRFSVKQCIIPAAFIAVGSWGVRNGFIRHIDNSVRDGMEDLSDGRHFHGDDYLQYLPAAAHLLMGAFGVKALHPFKERLALLATSYVVMAAVTNTLKYTVDETRPDGDRHSFPSGHAAVAFMGAELIRSEYGTWYGVGAYAVACGVSFFRLYNDRHWLNDILAGAGIGILSARVGYWLLPLERKLFKMNPGSGAVVAACPSYDMAARAVTGAVSIIF